MQRLTERQRAFVRAYIDYPTASAGELAQRAGYSNVANGARIRGHEVLHNDKVVAAITEELDRAFRVGAAVGRSVVQKIALDDGHPQQLKAAIALLDRGGFHVLSEQRITVEKTDRTGRALVERIKELALRHGLDAQKLIGGNTVEAEFKVVEPAKEADDAVGT